MMKSRIDEIAKKLNIKQNVSIQVLDRFTGKVLQEVTGHNDATNSLLYGVAHHLIGDFMPNERHGLNPGYSMLSNYVPRYISLGTMGLINQNQDSHGLPAGIGDIVPSSSDPEYQRLLREMNLAKEDLDEAEEALSSFIAKRGREAIMMAMTRTEIHIGRGETEQAKEQLQFIIENGNKLYVVTEARQILKTL
jgi:hypothetical protein